MDEQVLRERISELAETLSAVPRSGKPAVSVGTYVQHTPPRTARNIEEMLDQIRLQVRYLTFDLEATRRENNYLREMLESHWNHGEAADELD